MSTELWSTFDKVKKLRKQALQRKDELKKLNGSRVEALRAFDRLLRLPETPNSEQRSKFEKLYKEAMRERELEQDLRQQEEEMDELFDTLFGKDQE